MPLAIANASDAETEMFEDLNEAAKEIEGLRQSHNEIGQHIVSLTDTFTKTIEALTQQFEKRIALLEKMAALNHSAATIASN